MAHDALTKDELRRDPLQEWFFAAVDWVHRQRKALSWAGAAALAVIALGVGYFAYSAYSAARIAERFNAAEAPLLDDTLAEADRLVKAREAFKSFVADHGGSRLAPYAWMRLGAMAAAASKDDEAEQAFNKVIEHGEAAPPLRAIARTALARLFEDRGKLDRSAELYQALGTGSFGDLAEFNLARVALAGNKLDEARTRLEAVQQQYPESSLAALARDTLYFVH